jgi:hypothetical protein
MLMIVEQPRSIEEIADALALPKTTTRDILRTFWTERLVHIHDVRVDARGVQQVVVYAWGPGVDNIPEKYENKLFGRLNDAAKAAREDNQRRKAAERAFTRKAVRDAAAPRKPIVQDLDRS